VPSAITPETWNWVLNPRHADALRLRIVHTEKHLFDVRLFNP
jgi:RES domain-containing protein